MKVKAKKGDTLDLIAYQRDIKVESVIQFNPHLAQKVYLDANDIVYIPLEAPKNKKEKKLRRLFG